MRLTRRQSTPPSGRSGNSSKAFQKKCPPTSSLVGASRCGGDRASVADFAARWCDAAGERLRRVTQLATHGGHTQAMLVLLRFCVGGPAATFVLHTWAGDALSQHDAACRSAFEAAVFQVTDMEWRRLQLPASKGGLGFRATAPFAAVAFAAASAEAPGRISTFLSGVSPDLCDPWLSPCLADGGFIPAIPSPIVKLQKQWSTQVVEQLRAAKGAGRPQPPPPEHDVLRGRFRRLRLARFLRPRRG